MTEKTSSAIAVSFSYLMPLLNCWYWCQWLLVIAGFCPALGISTVQLRLTIDPVSWCLNNARLIYFFYLVIPTLGEKYSLLSLFSKRSRTRNLLLIIICMISRANWVSRERIAVVCFLKTVQIHANSITLSHSSIIKTSVCIQWGAYAMKMHSVDRGEKNKKNPQNGFQSSDLKKINIQIKDCGSNRWYLLDKQKGTRRIRSCFSSMTKYSRQFSHSWALISENYFLKIIIWKPFCLRKWDRGASHPSSGSYDLLLKCLLWTL